MHVIAANVPSFALFNLGGGEIILILAVILILLGAKRLPDLTRGLGRGFYEFRKACKYVQEGLDEQAADAGRSLGGIYGKPAAEALTPDNHTAELYDPGAFQNQKSLRGPNVFWRWYAFIRRMAAALVSRLVRASHPSASESKPEN
jgi:sec-independent protein translocase protein TatA